MKKILLLFLVFPAILISQDISENYIKTILHKKEGNASFKSLAPDNSVMVNVTYFDGLGRPKQHIAHRQSANGGDLVTHVEYDGLGRQVKQYLPFERSASSSIAFDEYAEVNTKNFYNTPYYQNTQNPYSKTDFENSPLNRVLRQAAPGNIWAIDSGREIKMEYKTNHSAEVFHFTVANPNSTPTLVLSNTNNGRYPANQLYKTITKDENWENGNGNNGTIVEFKNKLGQVVLKRIHTSISGRTVEPNFSITLDTYYVYDDYGNLTFVLSPKLSQQIVTNGSLTGNYQYLLNELGYRYKYDHRNRLINKKLPGRQPEAIYYDALNRVIAVGPVQSPFMNNNQIGYIRTKYDHYNRVAYTLWVPSDFDMEQRQALEAPQTPISETRTTQPSYIDGIPVYYTNNVNPISGDKLLTVNYYDDYNFPGAPSSIPAEVGENNEIDVYYNNTVKPKGMPTGSWTRALENYTDINGLTTYTLYDNKARAVRVHTTNHLGGFTQTDTEYDFIKVLSTYTTHKKTAASNVVSIRENMEYTPQERIQKLTHIINQGNEEMLLFNEYDALGQLISKKVGGTSESTGDYHQKVDFKYNIRGWLTDINNVNNLIQSGEPQDLFAFKINYTSVTNSVNGNVTPLYNGNIAETQWRTSNDNIRRRYSYTYDHTNRLLDAWYSIPGSAVSGSYNERLTYDANGNILTLQRYGEEESANLTMIIDDLHYDYDDGNKLINVTDEEGNPLGFNDGNIHSESNEDDFEYDDYGNLILDRNKNINEITYNHLNLPKSIFFDEGEIHYIYDANGTKLKKTVNDYDTGDTDTHYLHGFQYTDDHLDFFPHAEGYVNVLDFEAFNYVYTYKDHLGNIRLRYTLDPNTEEIAILEEDHYYPFGLKHIGYNSEHDIFGKEVGGDVVLMTPNNFFSETYKYKFGGKELQSEFGIEMYDFGFRNYSPDLGRWFNIDMKAQAYYPISPYQYVLNNPVVNTDFQGLWTVTRHYNMTYAALSAAGIGKEQADLLAHYSSVYADHPGAHNTSIGYVDTARINNIVHPFSRRRARAIFREDIDYDYTSVSQITSWNPNSAHKNFNIWHSMRSPWEAENNSISENDAMMRGMEFGWNLIFASAASGNLNDLEANSEEIENWGQGIHALQDAFAHRGTDINNHSIINDRRGNTKETENITRSAINVHNLLSRNFAAFNGSNNIGFSTKGMTSYQIDQVMNAVIEYMAQNNKKKDEGK